MGVLMDAIKLDKNNLVAHRGLQAHYPENTLLSLSKAIEVGAKYIELDVQFSADHLPIIYHDTDLQRVSNLSAQIKNIDRETLLTYPAFEPQRFGDLYIAEQIAPLEALVKLLHANPQVTAFVELKEESIPHCGRQIMIQSAQSILNTVAKRAVIISDDYQLVNYARSIGWPQVGVVLRQYADIDNPLVIESMPDYIFIEEQFLTEILGPIVAPNSAKLAVYEVDNPEVGKQLLRRGIDMLETFVIDQLMSNKQPLSKEIADKTNSIALSESSAS